MATNATLGFTLLANGQANYVLANTALEQIVAKMTAKLDKDLTGAGGTVSAVELQNYAWVRCFGHTVTRALTVTPVTGQSVPFDVVNAGTGQVDVTVGSTTIAVSAGAGKRFYTDGTTNGLFAVA